MVRREKPADLPQTLAKECEWREALGLIGDRWSVLVLHAICNERMRYSEIHRNIPDISQKVLTSTLRQLERDGIVKRTVHPVVPPKVEYELTALGFSVFDIVESLHAWSREHLDEIRAARAAYDAKVAR